MIVAPGIEIAIAELEFTYARSSGPGGQNVNKVNSKAVLRWNLVNSQSLTPEIKSRLYQRLSNTLTRDGEIVIASDRFRDQIRNREDCLEKLRALIASGVARPKKRKKTKPSFSSRIKAKQEKSRHSEKKRQRRFSGED